jgi:hypothetical protein
MNGNRRRVLRGILGGGAVTVALPLLDCFLNDNGTALANGQPMPVRFGTWYWGLGVASKIFVPKTTGANYELPEESAMLKPIQPLVNLVTNLNAFRDGHENYCHLTGWVVTRCGSAPKSKDSNPDETFDVKIANVIGRTTRYKLLSATAADGARGTKSFEDANTPNDAEYSPIQFYQRLFGPDFVDPNATTFTPNPRLMVRKSVLSGVKNEVKALQASVGASDRARLDQYFSGLRDLERQFDQRLTKPQPIAACRLIPAVTQEPPEGAEYRDVAARHKAMSELLAMAVACDQTRVFNMNYGYGNTIRRGYEKTHHTTTHEERVDDQLGYQPNCSWFTRRAMESWVDFVQAFAAIKEGDGTLLDNCLIIADSDHGWARLHSLDHMVMFTAGRAGGKVKTGLHIDAAGSTTARMGYTAMKLAGVDIKTFGTQSNETSQALSEILV